MIITNCHNCGFQLAQLREGPRILSWWGGAEISEKKFQIRIHIVLINYQSRQIPKNHCFLIY